MLSPEREGRLKTYYVTIEETVRRVYEVDAFSSDQAAESYLDNGEVFADDVTARSVTNVERA